MPDYEIPVDGRELRAPPEPGSDERLSHEAKSRIKQGRLAEEDAPERVPAHDG